MRCSHGKKYAKRFVMIWWGLEGKRRVIFRWSCDLETMWLCWGVLIVPVSRIIQPIGKGMLAKTVVKGWHKDKFSTGSLSIPPWSQSGCPRQWPCLHSSNRIFCPLFRTLTSVHPSWKAVCPQGTNELAVGVVGCPFSWTVWLAWRGILSLCNLRGMVYLLLYLSETVLLLTNSLFGFLSPFPPWPVFSRLFMGRSQLYIFASHRYCSNFLISSPILFCVCVCRYEFLTLVREGSGKVFFIGE